jgi:hypothetical protein
VIKLILRELFGVILYKGGVAQQMIQRDIEEALDLRGVQVHGQDTVCAGSGEHIGDQLGGDGIPALSLPVLTGVTKVGDHSGDPSGRGTAASIDHHQQFHQVVIDRLAGRLNQKHVRTTDSFMERNRNLAISKGLDLALTHVDTQFLTDGLGEFRVGIATEYLNVVTVCNHLEYLTFLFLNYLLGKQYIKNIIAFGMSKLQHLSGEKYAKKMEKTGSPSVK